MIWARESEKLLSGFAVNSLQPGGEVPNDYLHKGQEIAEQRLVAAAHRLADLLNQIFSQERRATTKQYACAADFLIDLSVSLTSLLFTL